MSPTLEDFSGHVLACGLLQPEQVEQVKQELISQGRSATAEELRNHLVRRGLLSRFQASCLWEGKTQWLAFGEYIVLDKIGQGGMGMVLKARHRRMDRLVAIKTLRPQAMQDPKAVERFYREVKAAARLNHPNIVTAYDAGEHQGIHYLVMEYVDGQDLARLVKQHGPMAVPEALECVIQAAKGLAYAHQQGVIHRDIKPGNLLLDRSGVVKILDMGLARLRPVGQDPATGEQLTGTGQVMGTCDYMAPEQAVSTHRVDHRADIYSLGCTLYRLLTGEAPYKGETLVEVLLAHRDAPIPSLRSVRADVSEDLDRIFQRMVAKRPEDRFQSMVEVIRALEACLVGAPVGLEAQGPEEESASSTSSALQAWLVRRAEEEARKAAAYEETETWQPPDAEAGTMPVVRAGAAPGERSAGAFPPVAQQPGGPSPPPVARGKDPATRGLTMPGLGAPGKPAGAGGLAGWWAGLQAALKRMPAWVWGLAAALPVLLVAVVVVLVVVFRERTPATQRAPVAQAKSAKGPLVIPSQPTKKPETQPADQPKSEPPPTPKSTPPEESKPAETPGQKVPIEVPEAIKNWIESWGEPVNLGPTINSSSDEHGPELSTDGLILLFHSNRPGGQGGRDIWMSRRASVDEPFGPPVNLGPPINSSHDETDPALSADGLILLFASNRPGGQGGNDIWDIWMSRRASVDEPFGPPVNLGPSINSSNVDCNPALSADGLILLFVSKRPGGQGDYDIWMSRRASPKDTFGPPVNLGPPINTSSSDGGPELSKDGLLLLFHSNRPGSQDGDIWMSWRTSVDEPFGPPVNLGVPINSNANEWWPELSADGLTLLLSSNRPGGQGGFDLWMCRRRTVPKLEIKPPEQKEPKAEEKVAEKPPPKPGEKPETKPEEPPSLPGAPPGKPAIQVAWEKLEQQLSQWEAKEAQFTQKLQPIEQKVHEWDFAGAIQEGQAVRFSEPELARRWQVRQQELQWLAEWKQRAMGKIQSAPSPLKKSDLGIRGMPGQVVQVDEEKITCELSGQKTETIAWNNLGPAASRKLVDLVLDPAKPDDLLKAAVFLASVGQSAEATRYFSQAQQKGLSVQEHLELASYPLLKELAEQLRKKEYASARSALDRLEKGPALADWRRRHQELLQGVQAVLAAAQRDTEAEKLYAEAVKLYKEQELHDVKPLVEKLRAEEYAETTVVLDTSRQPPISELEKATANLGPRLTVAIKGKADFRSIQAAIDAARGGELIEIQDNGPYQEYLVIPQVKNGLTIRGKRGRWPILLPKPDSKPQDLITIDAPQLTLEWLIVLKLNPQPAALLTTHSNIPLSPVLDLHHVLLYTQGKNIINNWRGQIKGNYSIILGCFSGINNSFILMNCLFVGNCECMAFPSKFHSSTINGNIKLISGDSHTITDSIVRDIILLPGSKGRIEHSAFFGQGRPPEGSQDCFLTDPQFMDPTNWDYRLRPGSPCIGKASDGGDIGVRWTPEMLELVKVALELRRRGLIK